MTPDSGDQQQIASLEAKLAKQAKQAEAEKLRHKIIVGAATRTGQDYFNQITLELCQVLGADFALIGEMIDPQPERIRSLAFCAEGRLVDNIEYDLQFTPSERVLRQQTCIYPQQVATLYPKDQLLAELQIEGYIGVPLYDKTGKPLGMMVVLYRQPIADPVFAETTLQLFANLTSAEILRLHEHQERLKLQQQYLALHKQLQGSQEAPLSSGDILDTIMETLPNPIFFKDRHGIYTGCNQAFCDYLGLPRRAIIGYSVYQVASAELAERYHQSDQELLQNPGSQTYRTRVKFADGSDRNVLFNKAAIVNRNKEVLGIVGIMTDITEIQEVEKERQKLHQMLHSIIDSMPSALIAIDHQQKIIQWNPQAAALTGRAAEKMLEKAFSEALPELGKDLAHIDLALRSASDRKIHRVPRTFNGRLCYVNILVYPLRSKEFKGAVIRIDNETDRLKMEKALVQSEKMLSLGGVAAGMAHEINNPLAGILQNLQLLNSRLLQTAPANQHAAHQAGIEMAQLKDYLQLRKVPQMLDMMNAAGKRAADIVQNMLSFSRKESGPLQPCRMDEVIRQAVELARSDYSLASSYDFRNIAIDCQCPKDLPQVLGIKSQLQQVLFNLLKNSAQAMANWSEMRVPPRIEIRLKPVRHRLHIEISDNGPGIPGELQKRIFDPFFTTKAIGQGTGLGLSVAYFIITETHQGTLCVNSTPGKGTTFSISLPLVGGQPIYQI